MTKFHYWEKQTDTRWKMCTGFKPPALEKDTNLHADLSRHFVEIPVAGGHARGAAGGNWSSRCQPSRRTLSDLSVSDRQGPETTDPGMSFASAVSLQVCCSDLSLVSGTVWMGVGKLPLHPILLGIFICGLLRRWFFPKLYCLFDNNKC